MVLVDTDVLDIEVVVLVELDVGWSVIVDVAEDVDEDEDLAVVEVDVEEDDVVCDAVVVPDVDWEEDDELIVGEVLGTETVVVFMQLFGRATRPVNKPINSIVPRPAIITPKNNGLGTSRPLDFCLTGIML